MGQSRNVLMVMEIHPPVPPGLPIQTRFFLSLFGRPDFGVNCNTPITPGGRPLGFVGSWEELVADSDAKAIHPRRSPPERTPRGFLSTYMCEKGTPRTRNPRQAGNATTTYTKKEVV